MLCCEPERVGCDKPNTLASVAGYPIVSVLYSVVCVFLFRSGVRLRKFSQTGCAVALEAALDSQRLFWKITGIATIVAIGLTAIVFVLAAAVGFALAS